MVSFSKTNIVKSAISHFEQYCVGYSGENSYITALVMGIGSFPKTFSHKGSKMLDSIVAYDRAEISDTYIGQINMSIVSSFCGPQGLIWGYDIAKEEGFHSPSFLLSEKNKYFKNIKIRSGKNLRKASKALFGSSETRHFPLLPGTHVPCAGKFYYKEGPAHLYAANAVGIPENRNESACLLMEDVGEVFNSNNPIEHEKRNIMSNLVKSVLEIGKNQKITYKEVFVDLVYKYIEKDYVGCTLVAMPYFLLAKKAVTENLINQNLTEWALTTQKDFLINKNNVLDK